MRSRPAQPPTPAVLRPHPFSRRSAGLSVPNAHVPAARRHVPRAVGWGAFSQLNMHSMLGCKVCMFEDGGTAIMSMLLEVVILCPALSRTFHGGRSSCLNAHPHLRHRVETRLQAPRLVLTAPSRKANLSRHSLPGRHLTPERPATTVDGESIVNPRPPPAPLALALQTPRASGSWHFEASKCRCHPCVPGPAGRVAVGPKGIQKVDMSDLTELKAKPTYLSPAP